MVSNFVASCNFLDFIDLLFFGVIMPKIIAYETVTRKGKKMLVYAGSVEHENAILFKQPLEPLVWYSESMPCSNCIDTIMRHGLEPGGDVKCHN